MKEVIKLAEELFAIVEEKATLEQKRQDLSARQKELENQMLEVFEEQGIQAFEAPSGRLFQRIQLSARVIDPKALKQALGPDWDRLATINGRTLNSYLKDCRSDDKDYNLPGVDVREFIQLARRKKT